MPVVSILIRHYNRAAKLSTCLESAVLQIPNKQKKRNFDLEMVLIDDGSTTAQLAKVKKILLNFPEVKLITLDHCGAINALNIGIKTCKGTWFTILDSDDTLAPNSLNNLWNPSCPFIYGNYLEISPDGFSKVIRTNNNVFNTIAAGILFNKKAVESVGAYDTKLFFPEYDLLLKLGLERGKHVSKTVYIYKREVKSLTASRKRVLQGKQQLYKKYGRILPIREYGFMKLPNDDEAIVTLRPALKTDIELILAWRSHPNIYKYFRSQIKPLTWEEHITFWKTRKNRKDFIIVVKQNGYSRSIGTLNLSKLDTRRPEVGILIGELHAHGKGIGAKALDLGIKWLINHDYDLAQANINTRNTASKQLFTSAGFIKNPNHKEKIWLNYEKHL